jgi:hypothetical protein
MQGPTVRPNRGIRHWYEVWDKSEERISFLATIATHHASVISPIPPQQWPATRSIHYADCVSYVH